MQVMLYTHCGPPEVLRTPRIGFDAMSGGSASLMSTAAPVSPLPVADRNRGGIISS